jgi:hypothetical protein
MMRRSVQFAAIGLIAPSGCFSGGYDADYQGSLQRYREEGEFQRLRPTPHVLADQRLALRIPKVFTDEDDVGDKNWSKPPFLQDFPGFRVAVQGIKEVDGVQWPAVLSVGVLTDKESGLDDLKKRILNQVQKEASFAKAAWAAVEGQPDAGGKASWSVLKLGGPQPFDRVNEKIDEKNNAEGETQIWAASDPDAKVAAVLVWRVPQALVAEVPLGELAGLVTRTVEFKALAEPAPAAVPAPAGAAQAPEAAK